MSTSLPKLIVVTGRPGAGKTTLAGRLADALYLPLVSRDALKQGVAVTHQSAHDQLPENTNRTVTELFFVLLETLVQARVSVVAEAAFQHALWAARLSALAAHADLRLIVCEADTATVTERLQRRVVEHPEHLRFHGPAADGAYETPHLPFPTLRVDTSLEEAATLEAVLPFVAR